MLPNGKRSRYTQALSLTAVCIRSFRLATASVVPLLLMCGKGMRQSLELLQQDSLEGIVARVGVGFLVYAFRA